jgi:hypothetical protein
MTSPEGNICIIQEVAISVIHCRYFCVRLLLPEMSREASPAGSTGCSCRSMSTLRGGLDEKSKRQNDRSDDHPIA